MPAKDSNCRSPRLEGEAGKRAEATEKEDLTLISAMFSLLGLLPCTGTGRASVSEVSSGSKTLFPPSTPSMCGTADGAVGGAHLGH